MGWMNEWMNAVFLADPEFTSHHFELISQFISRNSDILSDFQIIIFCYKIQVLKNKIVKWQLRTVRFKLKMWEIKSEVWYEKSLFLMSQCFNVHIYKGVLCHSLYFCYLFSLASRGGIHIDCFTTYLLYKASTVLCKFCLYTTILFKWIFFSFI